MADDPLGEPFEEACLWILERRGGDARFLSVHPAPVKRGMGISFEVSTSSRIEISRAPGSPTVFLGVGTADAELHERIWREAGGSEEAVAAHLSDCFEQAGLREPVAVERTSDGEYWIALRLAVTPGELASIEGRDRLLRRIEGFHLAFPGRRDPS